MAKWKYGKSSILLQPPHPLQLLAQYQAHNNTPEIAASFLLSPCGETVTPWTKRESVFIKWLDLLGPISIAQGGQCLFMIRRCRWQCTNPRQSLHVGKKQWNYHSLVKICEVQELICSIVAVVVRFPKASLSPKGKAISNFQIAVSCFHSPLDTPPPSHDGLARAPQSILQKPR